MLTNIVIFVNPGTAQMQAVYNVLDKAQVMTIVPGRKMHDSFFWDIVATVVPTSTEPENVGGELSNAEALVQSLFSKVRGAPPVPLAEVYEEEKAENPEGIWNEVDEMDDGAVSAKERKRLDKMKRYPLDRRALQEGGLAQAASEKSAEFAEKRRQTRADDAETKRLQKLAVDLHIERMEKLSSVEAKKVAELTELAEGGEPEWRTAFKIARHDAMDRKAAAAAAAAATAAATTEEAM